MIIIEMQYGYTHWCQQNNKASHTIYIYKPIELSVIVIEVNFTTF